MQKCWIWLWRIDTDRVDTAWIADWLIRNDVAPVRCMPDQVCTMISSLAKACAVVTNEAAAAGIRRSARSSPAAAMVEARCLQNYAQEFTLRGSSVGGGSTPAEIVKYPVRWMLGVRGSLRRSMTRG